MNTHTIVFIFINHQHTYYISRVFGPSNPTLPIRSCFHGTVVLTHMGVLKNVTSVNGEGLLYRTEHQPSASFKSHIGPLSTPPS